MGFHCSYGQKNRCKQTGYNNQKHEERTCIMMDVEVPSDQNISLKKLQKISKYEDLEIN